MSLADASDRIATQNMEKMKQTEEVMVTKRKLHYSKTCFLQFMEINLEIKEISMTMISQL